MKVLVKKNLGQILYKYPDPIKNGVIGEIKLKNISTQGFIYYDTMRTKVRTSALRVRKRTSVRRKTSLVRQFV